jgi:hypothetical protein
VWYQQGTILTPCVVFNSGAMVSVPDTVIWKLPNDVAGNIITENLSLHDMSRLDVACCAQNERSLYLAALRAGGRLSAIAADNGTVDWIIKRNLKVGTLKAQSVKGITCLATVVASHQLFETIELHAAGCQPSDLQNALDLLSAIQQKVTGFSIRYFPRDNPLPGEAPLGNLLAFSAECYSDTSEWIAKVISRNTFLRKVELTARELLPASAFTVLLAKHSGLAELNLLVMQVLTDALFDRVTASFPGLRNLEISDVGDTGSGMISQGVVSLAQGCPNLSELKVYGGILGDDIANQVMLRGLTNLRVLDVRRAKMLLSDMLLQALAECRSEPPYLTELEITWDVQLTDTVVQAAVVLANLRRLVLHTTYPRPQQDALQMALRMLSHLEVLKLKAHGYPANLLVNEVAQGSPNLRKISVDCGWQDSAQAGLIAVVRHCPFLEEIHTAGGGVSDLLLQALAKYCSRFRALSEESARCEVTTAGLLVLVQGCPLLTTLDLQVGPALNGTVLQALAQHSYYLEKLLLPRGAKVFDGAVTQLVTSCKYLNALWVRVDTVGSNAKQRLEYWSRQRGRSLTVVWY